MAFVDPAAERVRALNRNARLVIYRTSTPKTGEDFFVRKTGSPDGQSSDGIAITDLRIKFEVERDLSKKPNKCDIEVYNLAKATRTALETDHLALELSAGHDGVNRLLFSGDITYAMSEHDGTDWVTKIQVGDGVRAFKGARTNRSYRGGTSVKTVLRDVARSMGQRLPANIEASVELDAQFASGTVVQGATRKELTRLLAPYGYHWSFQNGQLQILRDQDTRNEIWPINATNGMLGSPQFGQPPKRGKPPVLDVRNLLYPELIPGGRAKITSESFDGLFKIERVVHKGDTEMLEWFTEVEAKPL